ncbi:MAG: tetratricopeptide repeat protein [Bacteroidetes bacterium]|nr:tetratricopeptide repeat protein [Bacteroidota bacterium]
MFDTLYSYHRLLLGFILFLFAGNGLFCQISPDSSKFNISDFRDNTHKVSILNDSAWFFIDTDPDKALNYARKGLELARELDYSIGIAYSYYRMALVLRETGKYIDALEYLSICMSMYDEAGHRSGIAAVNNTYGALHYELKNYSEAGEYFRESIRIYKDIGDTVKLGSLYMNLGSVLNELEKHDSAFYFFSMAKEILLETDDQEDMAYLFLCIGEYFELTGRIKEAKKNMFESLDISKRINNKGAMLDAYYHLGRNYNKNKQYYEAIRYLDTALVFAYETKKPGKKILIAEELMIAYSALEQFSQAFYYAELFISMSDTLRDDDRNREMAKVEWNQQYEKEKELTAEKLKRSRLFMILLISGTVLIVVLVFIIYRSFRIKQKANRILLEMDQLKSRLFSNISHELRTPLTMIMSPLEEILSDEPGKKPSRKTIRMMQRNTKRLLNLVNQMLDLSKLDAGSLRLELVQEDIVKFLRVLIISFASIAEKKLISFPYKLPDGKFITWFDPDKFEKIITNLLSNAFKFTSEGGEVKCEVKLPEQENELMEVIVSDTGIGIPSNEIDNVFDRFHQVKSSNYNRVGGTGIGLALTKELVELLHGKIDVRSKLGKGTTFTVRVPVGKDHLREEEFLLKKPDAISAADYSTDHDDIKDSGESTENIFQGTGSKDEPPLVLIVEDHTDIRTHLREKLEDSFRIMEANDGIVGLDKATENIPDLILTDLMMPRMDGVEMCKKIKTDERTSHIPVIMLTAKAEEEDKLAGLETGADAYIIKPFSMKEVKLRVRKLIEQRNKLRDQFSREITLEPKDIAVTSVDEKFLQNAMMVIEKYMDDNEFEVRKLQDEVGMSRMQLFRKLKALTGQTPSEFIRTIRLKRAAKLFKQNYGNVAQVAYEVGFNNLSYFAKCFKELFKVAPSEYGKAPRK